MHDEDTGNVHNRARTWSPTLNRFLQRDPLGYPDGLNGYAGYHVLNGANDASGMETTAVIFNAATVELNATGLMAHVGGMWNTVMKLNDTDIAINTENPMGWIYWNDMIGDNTIGVPKSSYTNGILKLSAQSGSPSSYTELAPLLHEIWHAFWDQHLECNCDKVYNYIVKISSSYGNGVNKVMGGGWAKTTVGLNAAILNWMYPSISSAQRLEVLDESIATTISQYITLKPGSRGRDPRSTGYLNKQHPTKDEPVIDDDDKKGGKVLGQSEWLLVRFLMKYGCNDKVDPAVVVNAAENKWDGLASGWGLPAK